MDARNHRITSAPLSTIFLILDRDFIRQTHYLCHIEVTSIYLDFLQDYVVCFIMVLLTAHDTF